MLLYAVLAIWTVATLVKLLAARGVPHLWRVLLLASGVALPLVWPQTGVLGELPKFDWGRQHYAYTVNEGLPQAATFIRHRSRPGDVIAVEGLAPGWVATDVATQLSSMTGVPAYLSRPFIHAGQRQEVALKRYFALKRVAAEESVPGRVGPPARARRFLVCRGREGGAALGSQSRPGGLQRARGRRLLCAPDAAMRRGAMHDNPRASPSVWQPDWLVLREMARVLRGVLADPALGLRNAHVLDFGCGTRPYESWFAAAGARYRGADIDAAHEVRIRDDGTLDCVDGEYDLVASFQVLEHIWDLGAYLGEARRVLRPQGWLLLSTHGSWLYHPHPHDYRRWTAEGLQREVESRGFRLVRMEPVVGPLAWTTIFRSLGVAHVLKPLPLVGPLAAAAAAVLLNARAWLEDRITPRAITAVNACTYIALFRRA